MVSHHLQLLDVWEMPVLHKEVKALYSSFGFDFNKTLIYILFSTQALDYKIMSHGGGRISLIKTT